MRPLRFAWDDAKNTANRRKHGVSFEEAQTVFADEQALEFDDPDHGASEARFLLLGISARLRMLLLCHCFREEESAVRIISARKATRRELAVYLKRGKP